MNEVILVGEFLVQCPACRALESLDFEHRKLLSNRKYHQNQDDKVYHDCGTERPCLVYSLRGGDDRECRVLIRDSRRTARRSDDWRVLMASLALAKASDNAAAATTLP